MMANLLKRQFRMSRSWMLFVLLLVNACQPAPTAFPVPQPTHTQIPIIAPTATGTSIPLPTFEIPTATPIPTEVTSKLTPNGPWLVYRQYGLTIVNQDGTGQVITEPPGEFPICDLDAGSDIQENPLNRLVIFPRTVYLIQPGPTWTQIYGEWPSCNTDFTGNEKGGLLASIYNTSDGVPELRIHELPSGKLREQFSLLKCSDQTQTCNFADGTSPLLKWSPNGMYLAFSAILDGHSSDLYLYDINSDTTRRLTSGPDHVGSIWWSPDGSQIIMGEIPFDNTYFGFISSLWTVAVSDNEIHVLYSLDENRYPKGLLGWLDNKRFIGYYGTTLSDALELPADHLGVVDISSGEVTPLFNGSFMAAILDASHETVMFFTNDEEGDEGFEGPGIYLISASHPRLHHLEEVHFTTWDANLALFVTDAPCENDPVSRKAFDYRGEWQCAHFGIRPEILASPDGTWQIVLQDGTWLKTDDGQSVQVSEVQATQIIWRPDSKGFFFIAEQILQYVSLPEIDVHIVDKYPGGDTIDHQWVGGN